MSHPGRPARHRVPFGVAAVAAGFRYDEEPRRTGLAPLAARCPHPHRKRPARPGIEAAHDGTVIEL